MDWEKANLRFIKRWDGVGGEAWSFSQAAVEVIRPAMVLATKYFGVS
jgi:hypothetical protein